MLKDSTINRKALEAHFGPFPSESDEQNALWAGWLAEFANDARVRPSYGLYLFARDWMVIAVATLAVAGPLALWFAEDAGRALSYGVSAVPKVHENGRSGSAGDLLASSSISL